MTFPVDIHNQQANALYDTGAGCSLINYSMYEKLGINLDKGYQPIVKSPCKECNYARSAILVFPLTLQTALLCITCGLPFSCRPRCALVWGMVVRGFACRDLC